MYRVLLVTGDQLRHKFVANLLSSKIGLVGIVSEKKTDIKSHLGFGLESDAIVREHFNNRNLAESSYFGQIGTFPKCNLLHIERDEVNSPPVFDWIQNNKPELIILFGSSIVKGSLLSEYNNRIINLHLGLSPYYRGSGTNYWPLVDSKPECVGATIHIATREVDAGNILGQTRPGNLEESDSVHDMGFKALISGVKRLVDIVPDYLSNSIFSIEQNTQKGKLFFRKDFDSASLIKLQSNFKNKMIPFYLSNKHIRDSKYPIVR